MRHLEGTFIKKKLVNEHTILKKGVVKKGKKLKKTFLFDATDKISVSNLFVFLHSEIEEKETTELIQKYDLPKNTTKEIFSFPFTRVKTVLKKSLAPHFSACYVKRSSAELCLSSGIFFMYFV